MKKIDTFQTLARGVKGLVAVMLLMLMVVGGAFAQTTYNFSDYPAGTQYAVDEEHVLDGSVTLFTTQCHFTEQLRVYSSDEHNGFFYSNALPNVIDSLSFNIGYKTDNLLVYGSNNGTDWTLVGSIAATSTYADKGIGFGTNEFNYFKCDVEGSNQLRIKSMTIFYQSAPAAVAAPTCTPAAGMFYAAQEVTLACATEGATIYYSMDDGATPYLLYNDPINITEAVTLKAFAVLGEDTSAVTTAEYTFPVDANTIAALKATGIPNTIYKLAEDVIVIYQNDDYLFVQDEDAAVVVYGNVAKTYNPGDVIADGFFGKYKIFNNLNELVPVEGAPAFPDGVAGTAVEPIVATVDTVLNNYTTWEAKLVKFENVVFTDATHFAQGEDTLVIYNQFGTSFNITPGSVANVTGLVVKYKSNVQIYPRTNADVEILSVPAAELPYRVDFDEYVDENLVIDNGTYTNKWYVGQAQDFDNNKLYISSSRGRTNKYNTEAPSRVIASRDLNIPANGAIVSFDCRYKGASEDYLRFEISNAEQTQTMGYLVASTDNEWENVTLSIPSEMAGVVTISFVWVNNASGGEQYPAAIDNIYIYESSCSQPAALSTTVDTTSATITWSGDAEAYLLQYKLANHSEWYSVNTNDTTVTLTNLQGNSNYNVRVQSVCDEYASAWTEGSFTVDCQNWISDSHRDDKVIGTEAGASTHNYIPFYGLFNYAYSQQIVDANEINASSGTIYSVSFKCSTAPASTSTGGIRIWLANTDKATFSSNTDYINPSELTEVYVGPSSYAYQSGWNEFVFTTPFEYTGGNLVVAYYEGNSSYSSSSFYVNSKSDYKAIYHYSDDIGSVSYESPALAPAVSYKQKYRNVMKFKVGIPVEVCGDPILCPDVTDVVVSDITKEGATIAWTPGSEDQDNFIVEYMAANEVEWTVADSNIGTPTYNLTGLDPFTNYIVRVKANCGDYNMSEAAVSNEFRTKGICTPVTEISHYNLATTAVLTWTPGANETAWTVKFKPTAADESAWVEIPVQGQATASLGGLQASTPYDVQILALCEGDPMGLSDWATYSFTSACATVDIPVAYTLKSNDHDCWEANAFDDYASNGASTFIPGAYLISPSFNIPREGQYFVSFDVEGDYQLLASYRGTRDDRFEVLTSGSDAEAKVIVAIPEEYLGRGVNFKFICTSESIWDAYLQVSNFKINACPFEITDLTVSNVTANTAVLSWTAATTVNNFQIKLGEDNYIDVEGATTDTLTNLEENTAYTVAVRTKCGEDSYGEWSNPVNFTTPCGVFELPFVEDFNTLTSGIPSCWDNSEGTTTIESYKWNYYASGESGACVRFDSYNNSNGKTNFLKTPYINLTEACELSFSCLYPGNGDLTVYIEKQDGTRIEIATGLKSIINWTEKKYDLSAYVGQVVRIIFKGTSDYGSYRMDLDNVKIEKIPTCFPPVSITASDLKTTKATLTWVNDDVNNPSVPSTWEIKYGLAGFDVETEGESVIVNDTLSYRLTGLDVDAVYDAYVRALCAPDDQSKWSAAYSFRTLCPFKPQAAIGDGTAQTSGVPVVNNYGNTYCQSIFTADELLAAGLSAGPITSITYTWTKNSDYAKEFTIFMGHTMQSNYSSASDNISLNNQTQVYTGSHIKNTEGAVTYSFTTPFEWDGVSNIVVSTFMNQPTGSSQSSAGFYAYSTNAGSTRTVYNRKDSSPYTVDNASANYTSTYRPTIVFAGDCDVTMTCIRPNVVTVGTVTENTAVISWTNANEEMPDHFVVKYGEKGFDVETEGTAVSVSGLSTTLTDLTNNQKYDVYVQAVCVVGADTSLWTDVVTFKTECGILELPYTEDFEDYQAASSSSYSGVMPDCWTSDWTATASSSTSDYSPKVCNYSSYKPGDGNYLYFMAGGSSYSYYQDPTVVILPEFNADLTHAMISFRARCSNSSSYTYGALYLGYVNAANEFTSLSTIECATSANAPLQTIALAQYTIPEGSKLAFKADYTYSSSYSSFHVGIDDILVEEAPTCITPTDLTVVSAADTTAQLAWTDQLHQPAYKVQYRLAGESTWQEVATTTTAVTLHNLQHSSDYEVRVLADCGEGDESEATEIVSFTTMCLGGTSMEIAIGEGTSTSSYLPTYTFYNYSLTQQIYTAQEINFTGNLNSVSFYNTSSATSRNLSVYLVHTSKSAFTGQNDWITVNANDKVFEGNVNFVSNDWTTIEFNTPFAYNGTDNVALIVDDNTGGYVSGPSFRTYSAADSRAIYIYSDDTNYNPQSPTSYKGTLLSSSNQVYFNKGIIYCPPTCPEPTALQVANVTANAATITWTAGGSENAWNVEYGKAGFIPGTGTMVEAEDASIELTGLEMGVGYDVYVQANCAADDQSEWVGPANFVTECVTINTLPYTQDFNDFFLPLCWSQNQLGGSEPWKRYYYDDPNNWFAGFQNDNYNSADLITPVFDLSSYESVMLTFDRMQLLDYDLYYTDLKLSYRTSDTTEWNLIKEYGDATPVPEEFTWKNEKIILPEEALVANVQFAFRGEGLYYNRTFIDNVVLMETPACYAPTALTLNDVTTTTANISWTAGDSVQTAWNVQYGEHNFTLGEGTIVAVDTTMAELTNLTGGTAYDVYVQSVCDESDSSTWAGPIVIATECVTINTLPYTQDFNDFFLPLCWSQNQLGGSEPWKRYYYDDPNNWFAGFQNDNYNSADLITPVFDLSSYESVMLTFDRMQLLDYDLYYTDLKLSYRTSDTTEWNLIKEYDDATPVPEEFTWKNEKIILPEEALVANVQFAFRGEGLYYNRTYIDNVVLMETPCSVVTDFAVEQDSITDTRAYITWKGVAQEYALEYQEVNDETWTVVPVTGNAQWLTNLTPSTNYNVRVKAVCGEEEAEYSEVIDFSTLCLGYYYDEDGNMICPPLNNDLTVDLTSDFRVACEINDPVVVKVTNNAYLDSITSLNFYYVVNNGPDTVAETLTLTTPLCFQGETTYTFEELPVFVNGYNNVYAWVEYNDNVYTTNTIYVRVIDPIDQYPKYIDLTYAHSYDGWNAYDVNEDGITMIIPSSQGVSYTYNDTLDANDWMITPCFYFEPGKYVISYSYNANSVLKESFEFWYGNGAKVADMTTMLGSEEFSGTAVNTASYDFDVTEAGVYNFGFWATSLAGNLGFNITNFSIEPVNIVTVTTDGNGVTTPSGDVYVNYDENLTLSIVPNVNYHLSAIYVDSVQVVGEDPYASRFVMYTLENVTEPHDVFVEFKLEFHTHKIVSNYNPAYDQTEGGYFVPAATDTTILVDNHTVFFAPNEHYHFNSLTLSEMDEESPVDFTDSVVYDEATGLYAFTFYNLNVPEYFVNAKFRRDTVNIHYTALTGQGYADASPRMIAGDSVFGEYDTWVDYDLHGDLDTTITITPAGDYHLVNVYVNGQPQNVESDEFHYTFSNVTETQNVDVKFGYQVTTSIRNYVPTYLGSDEIRGIIRPDTQLVAEGERTFVYGAVQEHFHLYNLFVDGVDMIDQVVFYGNYYFLTIDSTIANYHIEAVVKIDTFGIHYNVMEGQGYADASNLLVAPAHYTTWLNYGDDLMMSLAPDRGYSIGSVMVDGVDMYTASNYFFEYIVDHHDVDVMFVPNNYTITTNAYGQGTVSESMSFTYDPANPVNYEFTANAAEGYHISAIVINDAEIDLTGVTDTYTLTLENVAANYVINAIFEINTYNMFSEASLGGTITPEGLQVVNYGTDMTYEIVADEGRYISSITIDGETTEYTQADNVTNYIELFTSINADHSVSATFAVKHFTITAEVNEEANYGTIDGESSFSGEFSYGSNQTFNFIPEANYQVSDVVVDGQSVGAVTSYEFVNITEGHSVVVSFAPIQYTLTATSNVDACTITPASTTVQAGSNVNYTLTVAAGYHLVNVIANGEEVNVVANAFTIENVQEDYEIFANFASNYVTVTVEQPAHATITPGTMTYAYGATPSYVIVPEAGYEVTAVHAGNALVNVTYNNGIGSFTLNPVTADLTVTATTAIKTFTITATQSAHGTISPAAVQTVNYGGNVTYTITPDDYYEIVDVLVDGASRGALSTYTFNNVTANHTIEAVFEAACMTPSRLTVVYVDTNSATLTWEGNAASYEVRYRAAGETNFTTQTVNTNTITLTGLTENTLYAWGVKANCTATLSSDWAESAFRTHAVIPPYVGISTADLSSIKVYSNLNNVYIVNENGIAIDNVTIYNIFGAQVYSGKANNNPEIISLDVANGNYIVRLSTENGVGVYKLSIVR